MALDKTITDRNATRRRLAIGSNPERNRAHNRRVVLEVIRAHGQLGRTEIARHARLSPQAVTNIVEELLADGMLRQLGRLRTRTRAGQPPIQFAVNPNGAMTVGVEIAADHIVTTLVDLAGGLRAKRIETLDRTGPDDIPRQVAEEIERVIGTLDGKRPNLLGVGVVMPGPFEIEGMSSVGPATLPGWAGIDPVPLIEAATGEKVTLENDATAAAVGERLHGAGRRFSNFCFLYFGVGLGLGIIVDGHPLRGAFGNAGEIGHVCVAPRDRAAPSGPDGVLERHVSVYALRARLEAAGLSSGYADISCLMDRGEPVLLAWIREASDFLAPTVALIENIFDPETIIFGGGLPDTVFDALIDGLSPLQTSVATRRSRIHPRVLRGHSGQLTAALGAAALPLLDTVSPHLNFASAPAPDADVGRQKVES